jgi:hypothetical protein
MSHKDRRAYMPEQTESKTRESPRINIKAHLSATQRKAVLEKPHLGSAAARSDLAGSPPALSQGRLPMFPYQEMVGTDLSKQYMEEEEESPSQHTPQVKKKRAEGRYFCSIRIRSV